MWNDGLMKKGKLSTFAVIPVQTPRQLEIVKNKNRAEQKRRTASHFVRMSKVNLDCGVCLVVYLLHVGNDLIALLVARPRRHSSDSTRGRVGLVVDELV